MIDHLINHCFVHPCFVGFVGHLFFLMFVLTVL